MKERSKPTFNVGLKQNTRIFGKPPCICYVVGNEPECQVNSQPGIEPLVHEAKT